MLMGAGLPAPDARREENMIYQSNQNRICLPAAFNRPPAQPWWRRLLQRLLRRR